MARKKKPEGESTEEAKQRRILESVANNADRSEKTSWNRKMKNMVSLLTELRPIEDQIIELTAQKHEVFDRIQVLRNVMVQECVHPFEQLVLKDTHVECKFCSRRISLPNVNNKK